MLNLLLASSCSAFLYALWEEILSVFVVVKNPRAVRAIMVLAFSALGVWLAGVSSAKGFALYILSSAFFASFLMKVIEALSTTVPSRPSRTRDVRLP